MDDPAVVDFLQRRARDNGRVRVLPAAAITKALEGKEIAEFGLLSEAGAVAFTDGSLSIRNSQTLRRAMTYARDFDALIVHFPEDRDLWRRRDERRRTGDAGSASRACRARRKPSRSTATSGWCA